MLFVLLVLGCVGKNCPSSSSELPVAGPFAGETCVSVVRVEGLREGDAVAFAFDGAEIGEVDADADGVVVAGVTNMFDRDGVLQAVAPYGMGADDCEALRGLYWFVYADGYEGDSQDFPFDEECYALAYTDWD